MCNKASGSMCWCLFLSLVVRFSLSHSLSAAIYCIVILSYLPICLSVCSSAFGKELGAEAKSMAAMKTSSHLPVRL